jgi:DNA-binding SARP family transcriptional activator
MDNGHVIAVPGIKQQAVLALLALHANRLVPMSLLLRRLWPIDQPPTARAAVRNNVSSLRKLLEGVQFVTIETVGSSYLLRALPAALDLDAAQQLIDQGRTSLDNGQGATAGRLLKQALGLWRGAVLPGLRQAGYDWPEIVRLEQLRLTATEGLLDAALQCGRHREVVPMLERLTREHPEHEAFHRQRLFALQGSGRQADAVAAFHHARAALAHAGLRVGPALDRAHQALLGQREARPATVPAGAGGTGSDERGGGSVRPTVIGRGASRPALTAAEVRSVCVLCARFATDLPLLVRHGVSVMEAAGGVIPRRSSRLVVAVFGLDPDADDVMDRALSTALVLRRHGRTVDGIGPAVAVVAGRVLLLDPARSTLSADDHARGVIKKCLLLARSTTYGTIRTE